MGNYFSAPIEMSTTDEKIAITLIEYEFYAALQITYPPKRIEALEKINRNKLGRSVKAQQLKISIADYIIDAKFKPIW